jgi:UDP-glucuronate 4-epimerase
MAGVERTLGFELINLGESQTTPLRDLVALIERAVGRKAVVRTLPPQPGDVPVTFADIAKAHRLLDYNPQVKIEDGIPRFVEWFKGQA